jgi:hypothetical protein
VTANISEQLAPFFEKLTALEKKMQDLDRSVQKVLKNAASNEKPSPQLGTSSALKSPLVCYGNQE